MTPDHFDHLQFPGALINIVAFRMRHRLDQHLRKYGLDVSVWPVLACLWQQDGVPQARIGEILGVPGYAMSRGVDRLEHAGLVIRQNDPDNRRIRRVFLTDAGRAMQAVLQPVACQLNRDMLTALEPSEQAQLVALLRKLIDQS